MHQIIVLHLHRYYLKSATDSTKCYKMAQVFVYLLKYSYVVNIQYYLKKNIDVCDDIANRPVHQSISNGCCFSYILVTD